MELGSMRYQNSKIKLLQREKMAKLKYKTKLAGILRTHPLIDISNYEVDYTVFYKLAGDEVIELLSNFLLLDQSNEKYQYSIEEFNDILVVEEFRLQLFIRASRKSILKKSKLVDLDFSFVNPFYEELAAYNNYERQLNKHLVKSHKNEFSQCMTFLHRHKNEIKIFSTILDEAMNAIKTSLELKDRIRSVNTQGQLALRR